MAEPDASSEWSGKTIDGRYEIEGVLGAGGLGTVYRARHVGLDRPVAIKMLHPDLLPSLDLRARFEREVKTLSRLVHPHVVAPTDSGVLPGGRGYLVMELLEGESLEARLDRGPLLADEAIAIARQTLLALAAAHDKGVLHRDVKPANVFLVAMSGSVHVKLLDFGLAKVRSEMATDPGSFPTLTAAGTIVGTPTYMAPEQVSSEGVGPAADLYALGIVLYEMLAGRPPFRHEDKLQTIRAHLGSPVPELEEVDPGLEPSPALRALLHRVLEKEPAKRFASATEMIDALDALPRPAATRKEGARPPSRAASAEATLALGSGELASAELLAGSTIPDARPPFVAARRPPPMGARMALLGAVALAVLVGLGWLATTLTPAEPNRPAPTPPPAPPPDVAVVEDEVPPADEGGALSPFARSAMPEELRSARREILRGRRLSEAQIRAVEDYARAHPDDARPPLLLARHERFGAHYSEMVPRYVQAYEADASATGFAPMIADLVRAAGDPDASEAAADALVRIDRDGALRAIDARIAELAPGDERTRLETVRSHLGDTP